MVIRALTFAAVLVLAGCGFSTPPAPQNLSLVRSADALAKQSLPRYFYDTQNAKTNNVAVYAVPVKTNENPAATLSTTDPIALALGGGHLYVNDQRGSSNEILAFNLPITAGERPVIALQETVFGLGYGANHLYATDVAHNSVKSYALPLHIGERPSATTTIGISAPFAVATDSGNVYVANSGQRQIGTVTAYALPLTNGESPKVTLRKLESPYGVAVGSSILYVSNFNAAVVSAYKLPLQNDEKPSAKIAVNDVWAGALAVDSKYLYVSSGYKVYVYALPIVMNESPTATLPLAPLQIPGGLAVSP